MGLTTRVHVAPLRDSCIATQLLGMFCCHLYSSSVLQVSAVQVQVTHGASWVLDLALCRRILVTPASLDMTKPESGRREKNNECYVVHSVIKFPLCLVAFSAGAYSQQVTVSVASFGGPLDDSDGHFQSPGVQGRSVRFCGPVASCRVLCCL